MATVRSNNPVACVYCKAEFYPFVGTRYVQRFCTKACHRESRKRPSAERLWKQVEKTDGCWVWTGCTRHFGYGVLSLYGRGKSAVAIHRLSWELAYGPIQDGKCVLHKCDNPRCVRPDHLFLGTRLENNRDCTSKGRNNQKGRAIGVVITEDQVRELRRRSAAGESASSLARAYRITKPAAWNIIHNKRRTSVS